MSPTRRAADDECEDDTDSVREAHGEQGCIMRVSQSSVQYAGMEEEEEMERTYSRALRRRNLQGSRLLWIRYLVRRNESAFTSLVC